MDDTPPTTPSGSHSGIDISGQAQVEVRGDLVGGNKIVGYSAEQVDTLLTRIRTEYQVKSFDGESPYVGLAAFQETDAARFFGRETLIAELVARLAPNAPTAPARALFVAGPSGSGKSSLVRAGLIPALKKNSIAGSANWLYETMKPGRAPLDELGRVAAGLAGALNARQDIQTRGLTDPTILHQWADIALKDDPHRRAVIFVDQFEEVFTQVANENERVAFLQQLTFAATLAGGRVILLFALRSDFVINCASYPDLNALLNQQFFQVGAMTPDELVSAIARPALEVGLRMDPALIAQIVNDVRGEPGALPLMQFALQDLFEAEKNKGELTLDGYLARGGLRKALERHADEEFQKLDESEQALARTVFGGLIEIGRGRQDTKRTALFEELIPAGVDVAHVHALVRELADARLITTDDRDGKEVVTLAHEKLIDAWDWLRRLVNENREAIELQNEIAEDARAWQAHGRDASYLYTGGRLATAREELDAQKIILSGPAQEFIQMGVAAREAERVEREAQRQRELDSARRIAEQAQVLAAEQKGRVRIFRVAAIGLSGLLLVAIFTSLFALQARNEALGKENERATAEANALSQRDTAQQAQATSQAEANARATAEANALSEGERAEQEALVAESRRFAAQSALLRPEDLNAALLLAVEAVYFDANYEARNNLAAAMEETREIKTLYRRGDRVWSVDFSPDGKLLASGGADSTLKLWDVSPLVNGNVSTALDSGGSPNLPPSRTLSGHTDVVYDVAFSPDGKLLASASADGTVRLWDVSRGLANVRQLDNPHIGHKNVVNSIAFSPDSKTLASGSSDNTIRLWNVATALETDGASVSQLGVPLRGHTGPVSGVAFSPDGQVLASASADKTVRLWDVATHAPIGGPLAGHTEQVWTVGFSPDGKLLASGSGDQTIRLWDVEGARHSSGAAVSPIGNPLIGHTGAVMNLAFRPDGKVLASGSSDQTIRFWDVSTVSAGTGSGSEGGKPLGAPLTGDTHAVLGVAFSPDGRVLASASADQTVRLWDAETSPQVPKVTSNAHGGPLTGHTEGVDGVAFSPDGKTIASASFDHTIRLWDVASQKPIGQPLVGHTDAVSAIAFSPDGKTLASASYDRTIRLWDVSPLLNTGVSALLAPGASASVQVTGEVLAELPGSVYAITFSPDGKMLASGSFDQVVRLWDVATRKPIGSPLKGHTDVVSSVAFSPDSKFLVSGSYDNTVRVWDVSTALNTGAATSKQLGLPLARHTDAVLSLAFSPDGMTVASGSADRTIQLWDVSPLLNGPGSTGTANGQPIGGPLQGHTDLVWSVTFSPDGKMLASGSIDRTIRLWDVSPSLKSGLASGKQLGAPLVGHSGGVQAVAFSPDSKFLASGSQDSTIRLWSVEFNLALLQPRACEIVNRNLSRAEWDRYFDRDPATYDTDYAGNRTCPNLPIEPLPTPTPTP